MSLCQFHGYCCAGDLSDAGQQRRPGSSRFLKGCFAFLASCSSAKSRSARSRRQTFPDGGYRSTQRFCSVHLMISTFPQPRGVLPQTVHPVSGLDQHVHETVETEVSEEIRDSRISVPNFIPDRVDGGLAREIETALFVKNGERRIETRVKAILPEKLAAEAVNGIDRRRRQQRENTCPLPVLRSPEASSYARRWPRECGSACLRQPFR